MERLVIFLNLLNIYLKKIIFFSSVVEYSFCVSDFEWVSFFYVSNFVRVMFIICNNGKMKYGINLFFFVFIDFFNLFFDI